MRWKALSEDTRKPGRSERNLPLTERNGKISASTAKLHRDTTVIGDKTERIFVTICI